MRPVAPASSRRPRRGPSAPAAADMTGESKPAPPPVVADKSRHLELGRKPDETVDQALARAMVRGTVANALTVVDYSRAKHEGLSLTDIAHALMDQGEAVNRGDLASLERMLNGQAVALNAIFTELARRAALNMGEYLDATDRFLRLALKAQSQARATVETLAAIKNPPVVFARQANINNGGQQQVNNGAGPSDKSTPARPGETVSEPTELLEDRTHGRPQLDTRAKATAGRGNQGVAPVGAVDRTANG